MGRITLAWTDFYWNNLQGVQELHTAHETCAVFIYSLKNFFHFILSAPVIF